MKELLKGSQLVHLVTLVDGEIAKICYLRCFKIIAPFCILQEATKPTSWLEIFKEHSLLKEGKSVKFSKNEVHTSEENLGNFIERHPNGFLTQKTYL